MKKNIIFFMIGFALAIGISTYALSINARDTAYDNTNSGSSATNMQDAIDDLYDIAGHKSTIIDCGTYNVTGASQTVNISSFYQDYASLTKNNIFVIVGNIRANVSVPAGWGGSISILPSWSYSNGVVTISGLTALNPTNVSGSLTVSVSSIKIYIVI